MKFKDVCTLEWKDVIKQMGGKPHQKQKELANKFLDSVLERSKNLKNYMVIQRYWERKISDHFGDHASTKPSPQKGKYGTQQSQVRKVSIESPEESDATYTEDDEDLDAEA